MPHHNDPAVAPATLGIMGNQTAERATVVSWDRDPEELSTDSVGGDHNQDRGTGTATESLERVSRRRAPTPCPRRDFFDGAMLLRISAKQSVATCDPTYLFEKYVGGRGSIGMGRVGAWPPPRRAAAPPLLVVRIPPPGVRIRARRRVDNPPVMSTVGCEVGGRAARAGGS